MRAAVYRRPKHITVETVPDPALYDSRDILLRVTSTAICGSDLHIYNGLFPQIKPLVMGHEFMGVVEDVGSEVKRWKRGDRLVVPFPIACGQCFFCQHDLPIHCEVSNPTNYGPEGGLFTQKGGGIFGYTDLYGGYSGGQAELVRVPFADVGPRRVPQDLTDDQALFLSDILPTGYCAIDWAHLRGGESVAVFGCGPVGLMAQKCAWLKGASRVFGLDRLPYRLKRAAEVARSETIDISRPEWLKVLRDLTEGRGADVVVDAVGMEAHHGFLGKLKNMAHLEVGSLDGFRMCVEAVRRGGTISIVGVYGVSYDNFPLGQLFDKGVRIVMGQAPVHAHIDHLLELISEGQLNAADVISHHLPLRDVAFGYELFNEKKDDCVKVVLHP